MGFGFDIWEAAASLFFPPRCPLCRKTVETRGAWCRDCLTDASRGELVHLPDLSVWVLGRYRGGLRRSIRSLKYQGKRAELPGMLTFIHAQEKQLHLTSNVLAVPVPLHAKRERERGFNQVELIFGPWLEERGIEFHRALTRREETRPMYRLSPKERRENLTGAFSCPDPGPVRGRPILLLDDILTSGATLGACARTLREAGSGPVTGLVLASDYTGKRVLK